MVSKVKRNKQIVTMTKQTVISKNVAKNSEEIDFKLLDLSDRIKSFKRTVKITTVVSPKETEETEEEDSQSGTDRSMLRATWAETVNLYTLVSQGKCVTNFEGLVSLLNIPEDFCTFFVDAVWGKYWKLKKITDPDILLNFVEEIMNRTAEEYEKKILFFKAVRVRKKSYDREEIKQIIIAEINLVRQDAVNALYNCALRDKKTVLTEEVMKKIQDYAHKTEKKIPDDTVVRTVEKLLSVPDFFEEAFSVTHRVIVNVTADDINRSTLIVAIFENAVNNNQTLSSDLLEKLELAMAYDTMEPSILKVFIYQAQKGEKLTPNLNMILLNKLSTGQLPALKLEMLSCLGSLIEANQTDIGRYLPQVNQILTEQISSDNNVVQNMCITAVRKLITFCKHVDEDLLQKLVDVATRSDCNEYVRNEIALTFGLIKDEYNPVIKLFSTPCIKRCQQIVTECPTFDEIIQEIHQLAVENHFQVEGKVKDLNELLDELRDKNQSESELVCKLKEQNSLNIQQSIFQEQEDKLTWNKKQIVSWAEQFKPGSGKTFTDNEAIAVIYRANYLVNGHELTYPQILCSLIALKTVGSNNGKLLEVATGEGKSTIISILAIIYSLRGKNVDILTSSPILAERDAKQQAKLYKMFNLKCSDNSDKTIYLKGKKDCYSANIVYGEMSQFQFDILRDNYSKLDTLGDRNLCVAIVDEVDSMLIDDSSKIARLSSTVPGIDHLQALYVFIWQHLVSIKSRLFMVNNKLYFVKGTLGFDDGAFTLEYADANGDIMKIPDLEVHFAQVRGRSPLAEAVEDLDEFLRNSLMFYLNDVMEQNTIYIPRHFANFIENQKSEWIKNAVEALRFQENVQYIVQDGKIKPVDYHNTGIVQSFTSWGDGLQQFLQLKHNLKMTSETLITNFLSNVGLVHKYEHVCGLTGTLGSKAARKLLKSVYSVQLLNIPEKRKKLFLQLESIVVEDEDSWMEEIAANIVLESKKKRGILVVCETIESAVQVSDLVKNKLHPHSLKLYTINDVNQEKNIEKIRPGQVIIATNLAGRGTDIRTDEIEATGGLHVILTFMPTNQRVEDQAFGRTARQGRRGTGIMILNAQNGDGFRGNTIGMSNKTMKEQRDIIESEQLHTFQNHELKLIQVKDELFDIFCSFLNEVRVQIRKETRSKLSIVRNWFTEGEPTVYELCMLAALEEQWAAFLRKLDNYEIKCEEAEDKCRALIDQLRIYFRKNQLFKNPYYLITIANDMLVNTGTVPTSNTNEALGFFQKAVHLDHSNQRKRLKTSSKSVEVSQEEKDVFSPGAAHVGIAWCKLLLKEKGYKDEALSSFKVALKCLANEMSVLNATQLLLEQRQAGFVDSPLYNQLNTQASIIGSYMNGIESSINALKRSKRMIDLVAVKRHEVTAGKPGILETITHHNDLERRKADLSFTELNQTSAEIVIQELRKKNFEFSLEFQKLSSKEVSFILNGANLEQEDMEITSVKNVRDLFTKGSAPAYELDQFAARGLEHIIELNEKLFVPWRSVAAVAALGISQIIIGSVLIAIGLGSPFGWGIVTEGASDLPMAFKAYKTRQFNWRDYSKQKTVSLAISAATMGINYWETGLNAASSAVFSEVGREVMEQAGVQVVVNRKLAGQVVLNTSKNLKSLAGKACRKAAMAVAKECTSTAIQHLSDFSFALLKPKICESVQSKVTSAFKRHPELVIILRQLNAIDRVAKSHRLQIKVDNIVKKTSSIVITDFMKNENVSICSPLIKCVLSDSNMNGGNASIPTKVITTLNGLHQVNILADKIIEALLTKLRVFDAYSSTISLILIRDLKIRKDFAIVIAKKLKELEIFDENDNFLVDGKTTTKEKIDKLMHDWKTTPQLLMDELSRQLKEYSTLKADLEKCIEFTNELYDTFVNSDFECVSTVIKSVSDQIAQQLVKVMDPLLMQPWPPGYSMAENGLTDSISNHGAEIKYQKLLVKPGLTEEELTFMANYRKFRTVTQLLDRNARDHLTTHSNDGLNYNTITDDATRIPLDPSVHRMANDIREGKSINLALMSTLAKANGIKVKFVDDLQYTKTQEDVENDVEVMYVKEDRERRVSFALCLNSDGKFKKIEGRSHCCVFEAFSEILARKCIVKSVAELRAELADQIVLNSESFSEEIAAEAWVVKKYSDSSKRSFSVGLFHDETGKLEIVKCDDMAMIDDIRIDANHDAAAAGSFERAAERVGLSRRGSVQNSDSWHPAEHRGSSSSVQDLAKAITENKHSQSGLLERV
ncbi:hypothetical protein HAZT_HAZT003730, partial [Hyalella azteca]